MISLNPNQWLRAGTIVIYRLTCLNDIYIEYVDLTVPVYVYHMSVYLYLRPHPDAPNEPPANKVANTATVPLDAARDVGRFT